MAYIFKLPDVGEGLVEADIIQWLVKEGDVVKADDALVEIQNDKSSMEIPSPVSGIVVKILVPEGIAKVDEGIIEINTGEGGANNQVTTQVQEAPKAAKEVVSTGVATGKPSAKVRALPSVRRYARQQQVDLSQVTPTGPNGKILKVDVDTFLNGGGAAVVTETVATPTTTPSTKVPVAAKAASKPAPVLTNNEDWVEKMTPTRRAIAKAMVTSRTEIPHVTVFDKLRTEKLMEHRNT